MTRNIDQDIDAISPNTLGQSLVRQELCGRLGDEVDQAAW